VGGIVFAGLSIVLLTDEVAGHVGSASVTAIEPLGRDFISHWSAARLATLGRPALAYDTDGLDAFERNTIGYAGGLRVYTYPPTWMLLTTPLGLLPLLVALAVWTLGGLFLCGALLAQLVGWRPAIIAVIGAPPSLLGVISGQNGHLTAALMAGGLLTLQRRPLLAGMLFGLLTCKPQLGVLVPVALVASGSWRCAAVATLTALALVAASLVLLGPDTWTGSFAQSHMLAQAMEIPGLHWARSQSVFLAVNDLAAGMTTIAYITQAVSALAAASLTFLVWRSSTSFGAKAATLIVATFLVTPYARDYDTVMLIFAAAWLAIEGRARGFLPWERVTMLLLLVEPMATVNLRLVTGVQLAPLALWMSLLVLVRRGLAARRALIPSGGDGSMMRPGRERA
jgi:hypothetical protein